MAIKASDSYNTTGEGTTIFVCQDLSNINSKGVWLNHNPLDSAAPLFLLQLSIISISSILIGLCLQPLKQSSIVSQIFGGIVLGPSFLGHIKAFASGLFPMRGSMVIETFAMFGLMFFFFEMGVKMDPKMMLKPGKITLIFGLTAMLFTLALPTSLALVLRKFVSMDETLASSLPYIAALQSITAFPNIACLLTELKLLNSELGRIAVSTSMFCDLVGISLTAFCFTLLEGPYAVKTVLGIISAFAVMIVIFYVFRPGILWIQRHKPEEENIVGDVFISIIFVAVLLAGFGGEIIGQHFVIGPMMLGLAVPEGPPIGSALVAKLDCLVSGLLYPTFLTVSGLQTNIFEIHFKSAIIVLCIVLFASLVKIGAVLLASRYTDVPIRDALGLGLLLNTKGICELVIFNLLQDAKILKAQEFTLAVISVLAVTVIVTPLVRILYEPTTNQMPIMRRTLHQAKRGTELRILICIHNQDNVPSMVDLLEASHATEQSPISIIALLLVELSGRTTPMLIAHNTPQQPTLSNSNSSVSRSTQIINALRRYELKNEAYVTVQSFSAISAFDTVHEDICRMALDQNVTFLVMPFHKTWAIDGSIGSINRAIQNMNTKVLEKAPCSVGILVDRGTLKGSLSAFKNQTNGSHFHVLVLYIGGADDVESLSYAVRMVTQRKVALTVIRFLLLGNDTARERKNDTNFIEERLQANAGNEDFYYREQVVRDGVGLSSCIRGLGDEYDLILVGRNHQEAKLLQGLEDWSECPELGVLGDMLASPDFCSTASVLVVQQQRIGGKLMSRASKSVVNDRSFALQSAPSVREPLG